MQDYSEMDPASLELIQRIIEQDEMVEAVDDDDDVPVTIKKPKKNTLATPVVRWTDQETSTLLDALNTYGRNYKLISNLLGTRTPRQVKSRVTYLVQHGQYPIASNSTRPSQHEHLESDLGGVVICHDPLPSSVKKEQEEEEEEEELDIVDESVSLHPSPIQLDTPAITTLLTEEPIASLHDLKVEQEAFDTSSIPPASIQDSPNESESDESDSPVISSFAGHTIDPDTIQDFEIFANPEYFPDEAYRTRVIFTGRSANKTPQRYKFIRDFIIELWEKRKPSYVTKTMARKGLIGHGDVHAISRVHLFLEQLGAINVGAIVTQGRRAPRPANKRKQVQQDEYKPIKHVDMPSSDISLAYIMMDARRHRRVRNEQGEWINEEEAEGRVIDHDALLEKEATRTVKKKKTSKQWMEYDPFKLIPMKSSTTFPPFSLSIRSSAMLVMEIHAHLASTEIIGLLGGCYKEKTLMIECAFPCQSTASTECEMDPASEMKARHEFAEKGWVVVGWYHSHPTFDPHPSIRDIENQGAYQSLFRRQEDGIEPFVGVIVQPYPSHSTLSSNSRMTHSTLSFVSISNEWADHKEYRLPYSCQPTFIPDTSLTIEFFNQLSELLRMYQVHPHRLDLQDVLYADPEPGSTRLNKLMTSLQRHLLLFPLDLQKEYSDKIMDILHTHQSK